MDDTFIKSTLYIHVIYLTAIL